MEKIDITKLSLVELKALFYDMQGDMTDLRKDLQLVGIEIQKKSSVGAKVKAVLKQLPKGKK